MCLCGFVGAALITSVPKAYAQSNDIVNRLKRIENDVDTLNRAVYKGEKPPAPISDGGASSDVESRINQIETDLRNLTGKVEQQSYDNQQLQQKLDMIETQLREQPPMAQQAQPDMHNNSPVSDPNVIPPTMPDGTPAVLRPDAPMGGDVTGAETGAAAIDAASLYEQGFGEIKRSDYAAAEKSFAAFMKQYPTHALAPNALYWLGETYYVRKDYDKASRTFAEAYQKFPGGPKGADNLLKLAMSLAGKGEKENACIALGQLRKEYPKGPEPVLKRGEQEMATLGCKA